MPYLSDFFSTNVVKEQCYFRSLNCLSTVNEKFHLYFHSYMDTNVCKTHIAVNRSTPGSDNQIFQDNDKSNYVTCFLKILEYRKFYCNENECDFYRIVL